MSRRKTGKISPDVASLRLRIARWRQKRLKRSPMPEELWLEAARLAQDQGISPIARQLGVGYASLKGRVEQAQPDEDVPSQGGEFVELSADQFLGQASKSAVVELADEDGRRLTIRLDDGGQLDVVGLLQAFCGGGQRP